MTKSTEILWEHRTETERTGKRESLREKVQRPASSSTPTYTFRSIQQPKIQSRRYINPCKSVLIPTTQLCSSDLSFTNSSFDGARVPQRSSIICRSSTGPDVPGSGENENWNVLDAFFLGNALAEALIERIESTIWEFLSTVGRLQAEQQKQVLDFQEDVLERAKEPKRNQHARQWRHKGLFQSLLL
ncbi:hypothetical protein REPUB_Repub12eG0087900 [Reevesia pubescens]